ncbi:MAG: hypothetical protein ACJAY8_001140 [Sphingobacteriales bacterium]|jgi:hypothetical protein
MKFKSILFSFMLLLGSTAIFGQSIHDVWNTMLQKNVDNKGNVNYRGFHDDIETLEDYIQTLEQNLPAEQVAKAEFMSFWINAYNACAIYYVVSNSLQKSIKEKGSPWDEPIFMEGNNKIALNNIEHKKLRVLGDPRIHFAINCASVSCPRLLNRAFYAKNLEMDLAYLTKDFLLDTSKNKFDGVGNAEVSKIFKWFKEDFEFTDKTLDAFLEKHGPAKEVLDIDFMDYNWDLNGTW